MQTYFNKIFESTGLIWITGYYLPTSFHIENKKVYVTQLAIKSKINDYDVIKCANINAWIERDPIGQKVGKIVMENNFIVDLQMAPLQPGHSHLIVFTTIN